MAGFFLSSRSRSLTLVAMISPFLINAQLSWRLGMRSHALRALLVLGVALLGISFLAGAFSLRQPLVVAIDMGLSGLRFLGLLLVLFWMQEAFAKDIDRHTITFALAYPASRASYVLGRYFGVLALVTWSVALWGGALYLMNNFADWGYEESSRVVFGLGYLLVLFGIVLDLATIGAFFLFISSLSETPMLSFMVSFGFAVATRSYGVMIDYLSLSPSADWEMKATLLPILEQLRWFLPDLSRLDWRMIVLYDHWPPTGQLFQGIAAAAGYLLLLLAAAVLSYRRRNFA